MKGFGWPWGAAPARLRRWRACVCALLALGTAPCFGGLLDQVTPHDARALGMGGAQLPPDGDGTVDPAEPAALLGNRPYIRSVVQYEDIVSVKKSGARLGRLRSNLYGIAGAWPLGGEDGAGRTAVGFRALTGYVPMLYSEEPHFTGLSLRPRAVTACVGHRLSPQTRIGLSVDHLKLPGVGRSDELGGWVEAFPGIPELGFDYGDTTVLLQVDTKLRGAGRIGGSVGYSKGHANVTIRDEDDALQLPFPADGWALRARWSDSPSAGVERWVEAGRAWRRGMSRAVYNGSRYLGPTHTRYDAWDLAVAEQRRKAGGRANCLSVNYWQGDGFARGSVNLEPLGAPLQSPFGVGAYYDLTGWGTVLSLQAGAERPRSRRTTLRFGGSLIHARLRTAFGYQGRLALGLSAPRHEVAYDFRELTAVLIGAGVSYDTGGGRLEYSVGQYVPLRSRQISEPIVGPPKPHEPRRTRGGTIHTLSYTMPL